MVFSSHNLQSIFLVVHEAQYMLLSMMIFRLKQPENDIDVYLSQLIEDLRVLWEEVVDVDDVSLGEKLKTCVMLFFTINDFYA